MADDSAYAFASKPRAVNNVRSKYRSRRPSETNMNIMHDPRVVRGNTFASNPRTNSISEETRTRPSPRKKKSKKVSLFNTTAVPNQHIPVSLDQYLIEQVTATEVCEVQTQTDRFKFRQELVTFIPPKTGIDISTQISPDDNLFNFELEVQPLLNAIVGKTLEQALMEVEEEEELKSIKAHLKKLHQDTIVEKKKELKVVEQAKEAYHQKGLAMEIHEKKKKNTQDLNTKFAALCVGKFVAENSLNEAMLACSTKGLFNDPVKRDINAWLMTYVARESDNYRKNLHLCQLILDDIIHSSLVPRNQA